MNNAELWAFLASLAGIAVNIPAQLLLYRCTRLEVMASIFGGVLIGSLVACVVYVSGLKQGPPLDTADTIGLSLTVAAIYLSGCAVIFAVINLGESSLRIRIIELLEQNTDGVPRTVIVDAYNDTELFDIRVGRLVERRQILLSNGVLTRKLSLFYCIGELIRTFRIIIYGNANPQNKLSKYR